MIKRIAMWSGPRNISTAMMRAFENRPDCVVSDEPFYAAFLAETGLEHPMRQEVLASQPNDWRTVAADMQRDPSGGEAVWYQKHMCHHMVDGFGLDWLSACTSAFLIRDPADVIASYVRKHSRIDLDAIGVVRQAEIFALEAKRTGGTPPVIDTADVLDNPSGVLAKLCEAIGIEFLPQMTSWPAGPRVSDGAWAPAWYDVVENSAGFAVPAPKNAATLSPELEQIAEKARPYYEQMSQHRLTA